MMMQTTPTSVEETPAEMPRVLCCVCGIGMDPNPTNMCVGCIRSQVDIVGAIQSETNLPHCRYCDRYLQPPKHWVVADLESKELMHLCLKKVHGLNRVKLVDATFVWTESHSRRIKIRLTVQKEIFGGTVAQQSIVVTFVVTNHICETCYKITTHQETWVACVQARQRAVHKRTFYYLEQLILKNRMHEDTARVTEVSDGIDFFYGHKSHAQRMVDFLTSLVPVSIKTAEQIVTHDPKSNTIDKHYVMCVEIAPICREDLLCLPKRISTSLGGLGPWVVVSKVNTNIWFIDPRTLQTGQIPGTLYWKNAFEAVASTPALVEFFIVDIEVAEDAPRHGKYALAEATVCRASEIGKGKDIQIRTHLGDQLQVGDSALGYHVSLLNFNNAAADDYPPDRVPDVILVRKHYPDQKRRRNRRRWKVKELPREINLKKGEIQKREEERREFLDDLERDPEYRSQIPLYRADRLETMSEAPTEATGALDEDDVPRVGVDELLEEMQELSLEEQHEEGSEAGAKRPRVVSAEALPETLIITSAEAAAAATATAALPDI